MADDIPNVSVVLPTRDSMENLPRHVTGMKAWLRMVSEVVVVDSFSEDGTTEFLKSNIAHPNLRILSHPPGLYRSWNHGISQVSGDFVYISTAGDTITAEGLSGLRDAAVSLPCDVAISKPAFVDAAGRRLPDGFWPVDGAVAMLGIREPRRLEAAEAVLLMAAHPKAAFTGSCASCLFRTETFKRHPFRTDVGVGADGVWCLEHALDVSWGIVPGQFSTFLMHTTHARQSEQRTPPAALRADRILRKATSQIHGSGLLDAEDCERIRWSDVLDALGAYLDHKTEFDQHRSKGLPWILNPVAWRSRMTRQRYERQLSRLIQAGLSRVQRGRYRVS